MGEFADMLIDSYYSGGYWEDDYEPYFGGYSRKIVACNKCNSTDVYWHQYSSGKWFLFDKETNKAHVCKKSKEVQKKSNPNTDKISKLKQEIDKLKDKIEELEEDLEDLIPKPKPKPALYRGYSSYTVKKAEEPDIHEEYRNAPICPKCGDRKGFSFGTGDCGCYNDFEVGI